MKKYFIVAVAVLVSFASLEFKEDGKINEFELKRAYAQNSDYTEANGGDMTWDDIADILNDWDSNIWGDGFGDEEDTYNDEICDNVHSFCDTYDLTGDPVSEWDMDPSGNYHSVQTDDCDGQPNWC